MTFISLSLQCKIQMSHLISVVNTDGYDIKSLRQWKIKKIDTIYMKGIGTVLNNLSTNKIEGLDLKIVKLAIINHHVCVEGVDRALALISV